MEQQRWGQVINISSIGVLTNAPRFSAYVASKAALDAFSRCAAAEFNDVNVAFTTINMPLVRTPMIAPTKIYENVCSPTPRRPKEKKEKAGRPLRPSKWLLPASCAVCTGKNTPFSGIRLSTAGVLTGSQFDRRVYTIFTSLT